MGKARWHDVPRIGLCIVAVYCVRGQTIHSFTGSLSSQELCAFQRTTSAQVEPAVAASAERE